MADNYQNNLSEQLQLLHELRYSDLDMPYQGSGIHSNKMSRDQGTNDEVRLLDAIAVALTTGKAGDVFAAAFDKREHFVLVLAKNGPPTPTDTAAANELFSLIAKPGVTNALHLFPFLIRRCGANINKRIRKLHASIQSTELRSAFASALQTYVPLADIQAEFPGPRENYPSGMYKDGSFHTVWNFLVEDITVKTSSGLNLEEPLASKWKYAGLWCSADTLVRSRFLKTLVDDHNLWDVECKKRVERLKRQMRKVGQYISGISHFIRAAKRLPISHRWVTDIFPDTEEGVFDLCDSPHDAVARGLEEPYLSPEIVDTLQKHYRLMLSNWERQRTVHARLHAELRIILYLSQAPPFDPRTHPIGVSKRSCLCCALWIDGYNRIFHTRWLTSGSHGKPYANWALPSAACGYAVGEDGKSSVDVRVLKGVSLRLKDALAWLGRLQLPGDEMISDEYVSSDETPSGESEVWQEIAEQEVI